jgi:multiple sugar transport system permease protein
MEQQIRTQLAPVSAATVVPRRSIRFASITPYLLIAPAFAVLFAVIVYPIVSNIWASFMGEATLSRPSEFVGLDQYRKVLDDPVFQPALRRTLVWAFGVTIMQFTLGLCMALLLNRAFPGRSIARSLAILPWITPGIVVAVVWRFLYAGDFGLFNQTLRAIGLDNLTRAWLTNLETAMPAVMLVGVWKGFGFYMVMLLAGLQGIPTDIVEAARLDGAGRPQMLRDITLPLLRPVILMSVVLGLIWTSNYFEAIYILTGGGPARATETLPIFIFNTAFHFYRLNEAIAGAIILLLLVVSMVTIYMLLFFRLNKQEDVL